ncbi:MAG: hypothetical protein HY076_08060 [Candidatus Eisenbacteria bacterium]|uniref:Uncharacterized protein n=1 Tax=Eiseniibacteriota bacterium TaxID=2212470 RepID=A0A9D6L9R2_UNCEI|nr:hypothetical protein [Candidatus Eisenbacteria bacterium]MBI3540210.1 hypothetical protein [Candidatus Eisenbacteria bacterium]
MGIRAVPRAAPAVEAKATCASCGRPLALLKAPTCLYCGARNPHAEPESGKQAIPPALLLALEPKLRPQMSSQAKWWRRMLIFSISSTIVSALVGTCVKH